MLWTLDSLRGHPDALPHDARTIKQPPHPLSQLFWRLDLMIYIAGAGLAACVMTLLLG
jgi:hypothetical protein